MADACERSPAQNSKRSGVRQAPIDALSADLVFAVAACGGGADPEAPASRLEVGPQSALLIGAGASRSLNAQRFDAAGTPVSDAGGTSRAVAAVGSARTTATSVALRSTTGPADPRTSPPAEAGPARIQQGVNTVERR